MNFFRFRDNCSVVINVDNIEYFAKTDVSGDTKTIGVKIKDNKDYIYLSYNCKKSRDKDYNRFVNYLNGGEIGQEVKDDKDNSEKIIMNMPEEEE